MSGRLVAWLALIGAQILLNYAGRATGGKPDRNAVYHWSTPVQALVFYGLFFGLVLLISRERTRERSPCADRARGRVPRARPAS